MDFLDSFSFLFTICLISITEEKTEEQQSKAPGKADHSNLRRAGSTDLAERIMELKEALVSSKTNSCKTRKFSNNEKYRESKALQRTVSLDEVNILGRTSEESRSALMKNSTDRINEFQKPSTNLDEEKENKPRHLRRSVSENALHESSENDDELIPAFLPFRRFSQRSVKEQETIYDLVMENPLSAETAPVGRKHWQGSSSSMEGEGVPDQKNALISVPLERQTVRSPQEIVLEEADELSSVLGNLIDTLGSSTDSERESDSEKEAKKVLQNGKVQGKVRDQHKDEELESLCETLDLLINDNSSDSSSESAKENIIDRKPYNRRQPECQKNGFKPPMPPTRKTTQQLGKAKSLDNLDNSKRSSVANGRVNRDRVSKAKSVDLAPLTSNRRQKERTMDTRQNTSKTIQKNTTDRRESSVKTRAQRQKEANDSHVLDTTNSKEILPNKRDSGAKALQRTEKRPASKAKSVDMERSRTRPPVAKSKSVDHQGKANATTRRSQVKTGSGRSSGSEDDKKPPRLTIAEQTRMKTRSQSGAGRANNRASLAKNSKVKEGKLSTEPRHENTTKKSASVQRSSPEENFVAGNEEIADKIPGSATFAEKTSTDQVIQDQDVTDSCSDAVISIEAEPVKEIAKEDANWEIGNYENMTLMEPDKTDDVLVESSDETVKLPKEIHSHYSRENEAQLNGDVMGQGNEATEKEDVPKVKQWFPSDSEFRDLVQRSIREEPLAPNQESCHEEIDYHINEEHGNSNIGAENSNSGYTQSQLHIQKKTLLDIGKQQSKERVSRKEVVSLSLEERKQQILDAAVTKSKSKPADKRRSILQIKKRSDGNLVKNKKEAFEQPKVAHTTSDGTVAKSSKQRHFRFRGRRKKSFELSSEPLEVVAEDHEDVFDETPATNGTINRANGVTAERKKSVGEKIEEKVVKEKSHSPVKISPFQLRFTKRRGSYDLEKRASSGSAESPKSSIPASENEEFD